MLLSVVVTIVDGGDTLTRCLEALVSQQHPDPLEIVVPYDDSVPGMLPFVERFPAVDFFNLGTLSTLAPKSGAAGQHELFDKRRAAGLARAHGGLVAILEDRGVPRPNWAAEARRLHQASSHTVIGGAIENGRDRTLNWAVYFCDFGRYQRPFTEGPRAYVSDVNICYKRSALEQTRALWQDSYHEPIVHGALLRSGEQLMLSPHLIVEQCRDGLGVVALVQERVAWGRLFASLRVRDITKGARVLLVASAPLLPAVLLLRLARLQVDKRVTMSRFLRALPAIALLLCAWSLGEFVGYLTGTRAS